MFEPSAILGSDCNSSLHGLAIHVEGSLLSPVLIQLDIDGLAVVGIFENDVDIYRRGEEVGRHDNDC